MTTTETFERDPEHAGCQNTRGTNQQTIKAQTIGPERISWNQAIENSRKDHLYIENLVMPRESLRQHTCHGLQFTCQKEISNNSHTKRKYRCRCISKCDRCRTSCLVQSIHVTAIFHISSKCDDILDCIYNLTTNMMRTYCQIHKSHDLCIEAQASTRHFI